MKKGVKLSAATVLAISALTPAAVFAAEEQSVAVADGFYVDGEFLPLSEFQQLSKKDKKQFLINNIANNAIVLVQNDKVFDLTNAEIQNAPAESVVNLGVDVSVYEQETGNKLDPSKGLVSDDVEAELKVESVSAITKTRVEVTFNQELDSVSAANFTIEGLTVEAAALNPANKKQVILTLAAGAKANTEYSGTITGLKVDGETQPNATFKVEFPAADQLFNATITFEDELIAADGKDSTLVTFTLTDSEGNILEGAEDVEVAFTTTFGNLGEKRVTVQKGKATVLLSGEFLTEDKYADVTAQIVEAKDSDLINIKASAQILLTPTPEKYEEGNYVTLVSAESNQADRVVAYFNKEVKVSDFVDKNGNIITTGDKAALFTVRDDAGTTRTVVGLLPVNDNPKALQLILAENQYLTDNGYVTVDFEHGPLKSPTTKFKLTDARQPALLNVVVENQRQIKLIFSEALNNSDSGAAPESQVNRIVAGEYVNLSIDGKKLSATDYTVTVGNFDKVRGEDNRHVVTIKLETGFFAPGEHSVQAANIGDFAAITDARNIANTQTLDFVIEEDTKTPDAVVTVQSPEQYLIDFNTDLTNTTLTNLEAADGTKDEIIEVQYYDTDAKEWKNVDTGLGDGTQTFSITEVADDKVLVEAEKDWSKVLDTKSSGKNYWNYQFRIVIAKEAVESASNGKKNPEALIFELKNGADKVENGTLMQTPDTTSPVIDGLEEVEKGKKYIAKLSEPVQWNVDGEVITPNQVQNTAAGVPVIIAEFIAADGSVTVPAKISGINAYDTELTIVPTEDDLTTPVELPAGDWDLVLRSVSDDIGNTASTLTERFTVEGPEVADTALRVLWAFADVDHDLEVGTENEVTDDDEAYDYVFVKFSKPVAITGDFKNALKTSNFTFNGKDLPLGTQIFADIEGYDDFDKVADSITIRMPQGTFTVNEPNILNISKFIESADGKGRITGETELRLAYNIGSQVTVSNETQLIDALKDSTVRSIKLADDVTLTDDLTIDRVVTIDLDGNNITAGANAFKIVTNETGTIVINDTTTGGTIDALEINAPNAELVNNAGLGTITVTRLYNNSLVNNDSIDALNLNGSTSVENAGTITALTIKSGVTAVINNNGTIDTLTNNGTALIKALGTVKTLAGTGETKADSSLSEEEQKAINDAIEAKKPVEEPTEPVDPENPEDPGSVTPFSITATSDVDASVFENVEFEVAGTKATIEAGETGELVITFANKDVDGTETAVTEKELGDSFTITVGETKYTVSKDEDGNWTLVETP